MKIKRYLCIAIKDKRSGIRNTPKGSLGEWLKPVVC
ncbi:unknown [Prevotella sp. CAG:924]|nr:unknown [Prevotella sp. CAG:924]